MIFQTLHSSIDETFLQNISIMAFGVFNDIKIKIYQKSKLEYTFMYGEETAPQLFMHSLEFNSSKQMLSLKKLNGQLQTNFILKGIFNCTDIHIDIDADEDNDMQVSTTKKFTQCFFVAKSAFCFIYLVVTAIVISKTNFHQKKICFFLILEITFLIEIPFHGNDILSVCIGTGYIDVVVRNFNPPKHVTGLFSSFEKRYILNRSFMHPPISPKCLCNFKPLNYSGNSTPRDLVVTAGFGKLTNVYSFVKSLRTTHCTASIVIITDMDPVKEIEECGVTFIKVQAADGKFNKKRMRWAFISDFLNTVDPKEYDRIIYADLYDTVFQGDPFTPEFNSQMFLLSDEQVNIEHAGFFRWLRDNSFYGLNFSVWAPYSSICSGIFGIGFEKGKIMFRIMANLLPTYYSTKFTAKDQHYFNALIHSPSFSELGLHQIPFPHGGNFSSVWEQPLNYDVSLPSIYKPNKTYPVALHHIYRMKGMLNYTAFLCHANQTDENSQNKYN